MHPNLAAENVLATIGTIFWTCQIIPQIWKSWRESSTEGLSTWLMLIWAISGIPLGVYMIVLKVSIPLILQPQLFTALSTFSFVQCLYYGHKRPMWLCATIYFLYMTVFAGIEMGLSFAVRTALRGGNDLPVKSFGIMAAILISMALIPQYLDIWRRKEVIGLSIPFMIFDFAGAVFCMSSLIFKSEFDPLAAVSYVAVMVLDGGIMVAAATLNPRARRRKEAEKIDREKAIGATLAAFDGVAKEVDDESTLSSDVYKEDPDSSRIDISSQTPRSMDRAGKRSPNSP